MGRYRRRFGLLVLGALLGLGTAEVGLHLLGDTAEQARAGAWAKLPRWQHLLDAGLFQYEADPGLHYSLAPGFDFSLEGVRYRTNSLGMRGAEVVSPKPSDTRRILLFGDSYAYGLGTPESGGLASSLKEALAQAPGAGPVEVLNLGVPAFHTGQEAAWLRRMAVQLEPDLIVLLYFANDALEPTYHFDPALKILTTDLTGVPYGWKRRLRRSAIWRSLAQQSAGTYARSGAMSPGAGATWPKVAERLADFAESCRVLEVPLLIVNLPSVQLGAITRDPDLYGPHLLDAQRVSKWAEAAEVPCADLAPLLIKLATDGQLDELLVDPIPGPLYDDHFTSKGNRILAETIAKAIHIAPAFSPPKKLTVPAK